MFQIKSVCKELQVLSTRVILKARNDIAFFYVSKYMEKLFDKLFKNTHFLWSGALYTPTINHFLKQCFISRKRVSPLRLGQKVAC